MKLNSHIRIFGGKIQEKYLSISVYCGMIIFIVSRELGSEFKTLTGSFVTMNYCQKVERPGRGDVIWNRVIEYRVPSGALGWICQTPPWLPQSYFRSSSYGYSLSTISVLRQGEYFTKYILVIKSNKEKVRGRTVGRKYISLSSVPQKRLPQHLSRRKITLFF